MWICSKCGESSDDDFEVCWKCQTGRDGSPPGTPAIDNDPEDAEPQAGARTAEGFVVGAERATLGRHPLPTGQDSPESGFEYLVVPFVGKITLGFLSSQNAQDVSRQLQSVINEHAHQGWQFYSLEKVDIQVSAGCLASIFGAKSSLISFDQLVFRRSVSP